MDKDQYPNCKTCDHAQEQGADLVCVNDDMPMSCRRITEDFGCVLHSELNKEAEEE